ncbi:hypothetical protein BpHYR1_005792 [Brachionus plicatilis]|uniref:Uncharacterized protein n=1 Tax=Brachionus plicatilis TaxID=10195 RepID=A0A3M7QDQ4_BRAPC|nr:hypothetical protein BpHYR1_005792 [Brachionus plicatilis]
MDGYVCMSRFLNSWRPMLCGPMRIMGRQLFVGQGHELTARALHVFSVAEAALFSVHKTVSHNALDLFVSFLLKLLRGNETGQALFVALFVRLPPLSVVVVDHVQNVSLVERQSEFFARQVQVFARHIAKESSDVKRVVFKLERLGRTLVELERLVRHVRYDEKADYAGEVG